MEVLNEMEEDIISEKILKLPWGKLTFDSNICICEFADYLDIGEEEVEVLSVLWEDHYDSGKFYLIINCTNDFSVNPVAFRKWNRLKNLEGVAFVVYRNSQCLLPRFFQVIVSGPCMVGQSVDEGKHWIRSQNI